MPEVALSAAILFRFVLGSVLLFAGFEKLIYRDAFFASLRGVRWIPSGQAYPAAAAVIALELWLGLTVLLWGWSSFVASTMLLLTGFSLVSLMPDFRETKCRCFGGLSILDGSSGLRVFRNGLLLALGMGILVANTSSAPPTSPALLLAGFITVLAVSWIERWFRIAQLTQLTRGVPEQAVSPGRRLFLQKAGALLGLATIGTAAALATDHSPAEAACLGCGSCPPSMLWLACASSCCAWYYVQDRDFCDGTCQTCGTGRTEVHCGATQCC